MGICGFLSKLFSSSGDTVQAVNTPPSVPSHQPRHGITETELKQRIQQCLDSIEGITYEMDVPASRLDAYAHPAAKPVTFMVSRNGQPVLAIVIVAMNTYKSMPVVGTQQLVKNRNIGYMRFFIESDNKTEYIAERINSSL